MRICCRVVAPVALLLPSIVQAGAQTMRPAPATHTSIAKKKLQELDDLRDVAKQRVKLATEQDRLDDARRKAGLPPLTEPLEAEPAPAPQIADPAVTPPSAAATDTNSAAVTLKQAETFAAFEREAKARDAAERFGGVELGAGFSLTFDLGRRNRIAEAQIVNGVVRVTDQNNALARLLLETHYFFKPRSEGPFGLPEKMWGFGPFVAIQPGEERIIEAVGLGLMIGFRRKETEPNSFNIGVGFIIDPNTRVLGEGFDADQPPPSGETEVRYRETSQKGWMIMTSFSF